MTVALEGGEWSAARPGRTLPPEKSRYPFYRRLSGPQGRSGQSESLVPTGIGSRTVQPVVSRYTDWATRPTTEEYNAMVNREELISNPEYLSLWTRCRINPRGYNRARLYLTNRLSIQHMDWSCEK